MALKSELLIGFSEILSRSLVALKSELLIGFSEILSRSDWWLSNLSCSLVSLKY